MTTNQPTNQPTPPSHQTIAPTCVPSWFPVQSDPTPPQPSNPNSPDISKEQERLRNEQKLLKRENNQEYWRKHKQRIKSKRVLQQAGIETPPDHSNQVQELESLIQDCVARGNTYWTTLHNVRHHVRKHFPRKVKKNHCQDKYLTSKQQESGTVADNRRARLSQYMSHEHFDQIWQKCSPWTII